MIWNVLIRLALSAWLIYIAIIDWRTLEVPNWATVPPLLLATLWRVLFGGWPIGLALALVLAGAQWPWALAPALGGLGLCLGLAVPMGLDVTVGVWILCFILWQLGVIGGADAKAVMTLSALFPDERLAWLLLLMWLAGGVIHRLLKHKYHPALPAVALAGLGYLWLF